MTGKTDMEFLINQLRVKLVGASDAAIKAELFEAFREFFNKSSLWTEDVQVHVIANTTDYTVTVADGQIIRLAGVVDSNGVPQPAIMPAIGMIRFRNPYSEAHEFTATLVKTVSLPTPKDNIPIVPDWVLPLWADGIMDGVLGRMMQQSAKPYANPKTAAYHLARFVSAISQARVAAVRRNTFGTQAWRFPQSFRTYNQRNGVSTGNDQRF